MKQKQIDKMKELGCFTFIKEVETYKNVKSKIIVSCNSCSIEFETNWFNINYNQPKFCNSCKVNSRNM